MIDFKTTKYIIWLYAVEKWSTTDIAEKFNMYPSTVCNILKRYKIKIRTPQEGRMLKKNNSHYIDLPVDEIVELYTVKKWKTSKIAEKYFVCEKTILNRLHECGIETPKHKYEGGRKPKLMDLDPNLVIKLFFEERKNIKDIKKILKCSTTALYNFNKKHNIKLSRTAIINEENCIDLYVNQLFTVQEIADIYGVTPPTITSRLKKNGVKIRGKRKNINENNQQGTA